MKTISHIGALCIVLLFTAVRAQEITIETPGVRGFSGIRSINGSVAFTTWFGEKTETKGMANFVLKLWNADLQEIKSTEVEVSKFSELASSAFTGKYFLFVFVDAMKKNRTMVTFTAEGDLVEKKVEEDVRRALLTAENFPIIHVLNDEEFVLIRPM
jgi:hypothetical protein